jgi:hypothetical protein
MRRKNKHVVIMFSKLKRYQYVERKEMGLAGVGYVSTYHRSNTNARRLGVHHLFHSNHTHIQPLQVAKAILILAIIWPLAVMFLSL